MPHILLQEAFVKSWSCIYFLCGIASTYIFIILFVYLF